MKIGSYYFNGLEYQNIEGFEFIDLRKGNKANRYGNCEGSDVEHNGVYENLISVLNSDTAVSTNADDA